MRVVKLGGSLADWERLPECLTSLLPLGVIIVPGGGPFADQVRTMQHRWRFDDGAAHAMAILAMSQFGWMLTGLENRLGVGGSCEELQRQAAAGRTAVWLPRLEDLEDEPISASWEITSDSLAAWLAGRLGAAELILLKSARYPSPAECGPQRLAAAGIVDEGFGDFAARGRFSTWLCHRDDFAALAAGRPGGPYSSPLQRVACGRTGGA